MEEEKTPSSEFFDIYETEKYKVYHTSTITTILELAEAVKRNNRPSILKNQKALDTWDILELALHDREFNKVMEKVLWMYSISWKYIKRYYLFFNQSGDGWLLFCPLRRRVCIQLAVFGEKEKANNIVVNIYYY